MAAKLPIYALRAMLTLRLPEYVPYLSESIAVAHETAAYRANTQGSKSVDCIGATVPLQSADAAGVGFRVRAQGGCSRFSTTRSAFLDVIS